MFLASENIDFTGLAHVFLLGGGEASPFVAPRKGGITILRDGYTMRRFTPSYIAPKRPLTIDDLTKRGFGEALYPLSRRSSGRE